MVDKVSAGVVPGWKVSGDWFDVCKCSIPCPCTYAQAPTYGDCDGVLAYHIRSGHYGEASLDRLNVLGLLYFKGNIWAGEAKASIGLFFDEKANPQQREALQMIFSGKAGGFMAEFARAIQEEELNLFQSSLKFRMTSLAGVLQFQERLSQGLKR